MNPEIEWLLNAGDGPRSRHIVRLNRAEAECLFCYAQKAKYRMLEIGRCYGGSACLISAARPSIPLDSYDLTMTLKPECIGFLQNRDVSLRLGNTNTVSFAHKYDFVFIDGDHSYEGVKADFENVLPSLLPGAVILFHDAVRGAYGTCEGVERFTTELLESNKVKRLSVADSMLAVELL